MSYPSKYPKAEGADLDAMAENMMITRVAGEDDDALRKRILDYVRQPQPMLPIGRRQKVAIWLSRHRMPTFAYWLFPGYYWRISGPRYIGEMPPRWVNEVNVDGGFSYP